jgi:hypothetical protein
VIVSQEVRQARSSSNILLSSEQATERLTLPLVKEVPISKHKNGLERNKNVIMGPTGSGTMNDYAGEDQQKNTTLLSLDCIVSVPEL